MIDIAAEAGRRAEDIGLTGWAIRGYYLTYVGWSSSEIEIAKKNGLVTIHLTDHRVDATDVCYGIHEADDPLDFIITEVLTGRAEIYR